MANTNGSNEMKAVKDTVRFIELGLKTLNLTSTIEVEQESDTEFNINLPGLGINVFVDTEGDQRNGIGGNFVRIPSWQVGTIEHLPATFEEPEDVDIIVRGTFTNVSEAVARVFELVVKNTIQSVIEATAYAEDLAADHALAESNGYHGLHVVKS